MSSGSLLDVMRPCGRFVVAGAGLEAAVQDAHESGKNWGRLATASGTGSGGGGDLGDSGDHCSGHW